MLTLVALATVSCGSGSDDSNGTVAAEDSAVTAAPAADDSAAAASPPDTDPVDTEPASPPADALTGAQICERLDVAVVAAALGVEVTGATPDDASTPQCSYSFVTAAGTPTNATVAFMRPDGDLGGRVGVEAYEYVVSLNRSIAADAEVVELPAGDAATRLSGASLHLGVVRLGDRVVTLIVAAGDAPTSAVDALIATVAATFA
jgi:hypothetical protein